MSLNNLIDFDYDLPEHLIALEPKHPRTASKLLVYSKGELFDSQFKLLCKYLKPNDRLIFNDTKVLNARLLGERKRFTPSGKLITKIDYVKIQPIWKNSNYFHNKCKSFWKMYFKSFLFD